MYLFRKYLILSRFNDFTEDIFSSDGKACSLELYYYMLVERERIASRASMRGRKVYGYACTKVESRI